MRRLLICMLLLGSVAAAQDRIEKNLGDFSEVKTYRGLQVELIQADSPKLVIEGIKSSSVTYKNSNGVLKLSLKIENTFSSDEVMVYLYYSDPLSVIDGNEGSNIYSDDVIEQEQLEVHAQEGARIKLELDTKDVEVTAASGGYISLKGKSESQRVKVHTGGIYKGERLETQRTDVSAATGGIADVRAEKSMKARASTAGSIDIHGEPEELDRKESTGGKISH